MRALRPGSIPATWRKSCWRCTIPRPTPSSSAGISTSSITGRPATAAFWTDTEQLKYHIRKAGLAPGDARYEMLLQPRPGRPDVEGWSKGAYRSTDGMVRHSLGSTIEHSGLGGNAAYWRKT